MARSARSTSSLSLRLLGIMVALATAAAPVLAQSTLRPAGAPMPVVGSEASTFAHPVWSPDGTRLALTRPGYTGLWTVRSDGQGLRQVTDEPAAGFGFSWSPDGQALLARVARFDGALHESAVKVFDLSSGTAETLTEYRAQIPALPQWSSDGSTVLLPGRDGVEVLDRSAAPAPPVREAAGDAAFVVADRTLSAVRSEASGLRAEALVADRRIINAVASPDRDRVAFEVVGGNLHVVDADGRNLLDLGPGHRPSWSPDGQWLVFMRTEDDGERFTSSDLWAARTDGSVVVALTQTPSALEMNPSWSPDGTSIAFDDLENGTVYLLPVAR